MVTRADRTLVDWNGEPVGTEDNPLKVGGSVTSEGGATDSNQETMITNQSTIISDLTTIITNIQDLITEHANSATDSNQETMITNQSTIITELTTLNTNIQDLMTTQQNVLSVLQSLLSNQDTKTYYGLSTDVKVEGQVIGEKYREIDTDVLYYWDGTQWIVPTTV